MEGGEVAEGEEERAEAGEAEQERGVMAKDKEETSVGEKETYKCSEEKGGHIGDSSVARVQSDGLPFTSGKFTGKNSVPVFDLFYFQALTLKEGRVRGATGQRKKRPERESRGRIV